MGAMRSGAAPHSSRVAAIHSRVAGSEKLGWQTPLGVLCCYIVCVLFATYPLILTFRSTLPGSLTDPLQHLWLMRWYKICLTDCRFLNVCPEIMYPLGVPLGNFSPLHLQALLYIPLSVAIANDVLCFNLIWLAGIVFTGMGTFWLIWQMLRDRACAAFGGMLAMLSGPMLQHAQAHLELICLGGVPLFLAAWLRFVDRPSRRSLAASLAMYVLVALCAAYYTPLAAVPAVLYVACRGARALRRRQGRWLAWRAAWLVAFAGLALPILGLLFANQFWALAHGYAIDRSMYEFRRYGAPLWAYATPTPNHVLGRLLPFDPYQRADFTATPVEGASYLGLVTLLLVVYAAVARPRIRRASFWWITLAVLVLLGCGAFGHVGPWRVSLPAAWLKSNVAAFRQIRVPARFNLIVAILTALLAAAGLKRLLAGVAGPARRGAVLVCVWALAAIDLANVPFPRAAIPPIPACYAWLRQRDPRATMLEIPQYDSNGSYLYAICAYWQSSHRGRTNAGYCGQANVRYDNLISRATPFLARWMEQPGYLDDAAGPARRTPPSDGGPSFCEIVTATAFLDYAWLFTTVHRFDYVILHQWRDGHFHLPEQTRLKHLLEDARVFEDADTMIFARERMHKPSRPVAVPTRGWRPTWEGRPCRVVERVAHLAAYDPNPGRDLILTLEAKAFRSARMVRLMCGPRELASWRLEPDRFQVARSRPFRIGAGIQELRLESDADETPMRRSEMAWETDKAPYSFRITRLTLSRPEPAAGGGRACDVD